MRSTGHKSRVFDTNAAYENAYTKAYIKSFGEAFDKAHYD